MSAIAWSVAATNALSAACLFSSVSTPAMSPFPGSGRIESTVMTVVGVPASWSWTGSLLTNPGRRVDRPLRSAAPCPKSG